MHIASVRLVSYNVATLRSIHSHIRDRITCFFYYKFIYKVQLVRNLLKKKKIIKNNNKKKTNVRTWRVKLRYDSNSTQSAVLDQRLNISLGVDVREGVVRSFLTANIKFLIIFIEFQFHTFLEHIILERNLFAIIYISVTSAVQFYYYYY